MLQTLQGEEKNLRILGEKITRNDFKALNLTNRLLWLKLNANIKFM